MTPSLNLTREIYAQVSRDIQPIDDFGTWGPRAILSTRSLQTSPLPSAEMASTSTSRCLGEISIWGSILARLGSARQSLLVHETQVPL